MQKQVNNNYISNFFASHLCRYRKGLSTKYILLTLSESWRTCLDKKGVCENILMDLFKALDTINYETLIAKLQVYESSN